MSLQIRLSLPEFSNGVNFSDPIIMDLADNISLLKTVNSASESITFDIPVNDPKIAYVNYLRWWECWDTETNARINYGPIHDMSGSSGATRKVAGPGRSALLEDYYKSVQTFYYPISQFLDDLRFENLSAEPRTSTIINKNTASDYYGLSMRTKDFAIDEQTGFIAIGRDTPAKGTIKTDSFWAGVARADYLTVDLGEKYVVSKVRVLLPWWGGETINNERAYDWDYSYSDDNSSFTQVYQTPIPNHHGTAPPVGTTLYFGESGFESDQQTPSLSSISAQYWKLNITNTHAWYGNVFLGTPSDEWAWECGESNVLVGVSTPSPTISGGIINKNELTPSNDCYASAVELAFYRKIVGRDSISNLSYLQIQNDNRQVTYYHVPTAPEMISAGGSVKFEPGTFFRKVTFTVAGTTTIKDEYNTLLYSGGSGTLNCPAYTRLLKFSNTSSQVVQADTWQGKLDAFSFGGNYQYSTVANDTATLHFRGVSVKWYATIPFGVVAGQVSIQLRSKSDLGVWGAWATQVAVLTLPTDVSAYKVWEITPESGILSGDTVYELKITNLNGGFVGVDSFTGYWSASSENLNEDDSRISVRLPSEVIQQFDQKFTYGSINKFVGGGFTKQGLQFTGDRVIVYSRKGPGYGIIKMGLVQFLSTGSTVLHIPGGDADGSVIVDLESPYEIPQAIVFDSNDYFTAPNDGLPWAGYFLGIYKPKDVEPIWVDGITVHESTGLSVKFLNTNYLEILKSTAEALQMEWDITEAGIKVVPRLGKDTDEIYAEGRGTTINIDDVEDVTQVATMLIVTGADIDGLPLSAVIENKNTKKIIKRTIQRLYDLRNTSDYFTLIGAGRTELLKRRAPQKRVTIQRVGTINTAVGDSFIVKKKTLEGRFRAVAMTRTQSNANGTSYSLECLEWPPIV